MLQFLKIFILFIAVGVFLAASNVKVYLETEPQEIYSGEELNVSLNIETPKRVDIKFPEVDKIANLPVIAIQDKKRSIIKEINNTQIAVAKITRTYTILPTKPITVGPLSVTVDGKKYTTQSKKIEINNLTKGNNFLFRMSSNKKEVVVGEPFVVKVELIEPVALSSANIEYLAPKFENFTVAALGAGETVQKGNNLIRTIRYLLRAKSAGKYTLEPATAKVEIQTVPVAQSPFAFFGTEDQWKNLVTNTLSVTVKELPQKVDLIGSFTMKGSVDKLIRSAKKPIEYTLTISGKGSLESLKDLKFTIPNVTIYKKEPKIEHIANDNGIESRYRRKYIFIADHDFVIPSLTITEFNTEKRTIETLRTEPFKIHIKDLGRITSLLKDKNKKTKAQNILTKEKVTQKSEILPPKKNPKEIQKENKIEKIEDILIDKNYYKRKYSKEGYSLITLLFAMLLGVIIGFLAATYIPKILEEKKTKKRKEELYEGFNDALNILYPHTTEDPKIEEMVKNLYEVVNGNHTISIDKKLLDKMIKKIKKRGKKKSNRDHS